MTELMSLIQFESVEAFLRMGGHGVYVWSAYAFALVVTGYNLVRPVIRRKNFFSTQVKRMDREQLK